MNDIVDPFLLVYAGLFPIVNPVGNAPIFLTVTHNSETMQRSLAGRVAFNGFILLLGSLFVGARVPEFFGITVPVLRIAGGLVVAAFGWRLLHDGVEPAREAGQVDDRCLTDAFYLLTMPLTVGPGAISVAIALGSEWSQRATDFTETGLLCLSSISGLAAFSLTVFLRFQFADRMISLLGRRGISVLMHLSAFIPLCIGIQIMSSGYIALIMPPRD